MQDLNTVTLLELVASKICHDIISPVGAVSNGVEILEELGPDAGEDVTDLIAFSASQANAKLKALRMAYGLGGADESMRIEDTHKTFGELISGEKRLSQSWDPYADLGIEPVKGYCKLLLCGLIFVSEGLPKGGILSVSNDGDNTTLITGSGENAHYRDNFVAALHHQLPISSIDPKLVHPYVTGLIAQKYGFTISTEETGANQIFLRLKLSNSPE